MADQQVLNYGSALYRAKQRHKVHLVGERSGKGAFRWPCAQPEPTHPIKLHVRIGIGAVRWCRAPADRLWPAPGGKAASRVQATWVRAKWRQSRSAASARDSLVLWEGAALHFGGFWVPRSCLVSAVLRYSLRHDVGFICIGPCLLRPLARPEPRFGVAHKVEDAIGSTQWRRTICSKGHIPSPEEAGLALCAIRRLAPVPKTAASASSRSQLPGFGCIL